MNPSIKWPLAAAVLALSSTGKAEGVTRHPVPAAQHGGTVVQLCDGETSTEVASLSPGETLPRDEAQQVAKHMRRIALIRA